MSQAVKMTVYAVLLLVSAVCGSVSIRDYRRIMQAPADSDPATQTTPAEPESGRIAPAPYGRMLTFGAVGFFGVVALALLVARDFAQWVGERTEHFLMSDEGEGIPTPEYEEAERVWGEGDFLGAIQLLRDYLKKEPRALHVALRIAEIYEKDLNHPLAAALEYEELIKHKLPPERWGWAAIHLANLYSGKLQKPDQAVALLRRIVDEYSATAAARKARERLAIDEPAAPAPETASKPEESPKPEGGPKQPLPPGFSRFKK